MNRCKRQFCELSEVINCDEYTEDNEEINEKIVIEEHMQEPMKS